MSDDDSGWVAEERTLFMLLRRALLHQSSSGFEAVNDLKIEDMPLDWDRFIDYAVQGGVAPMVYVRLREDQSNIPAEVMGRLHGFYVLTAAENMEYLSYAREIFGRCKNKEIDVIALRGITFAEVLYPDPALRPISDIDLLVRPEQMSRLMACLLSLGYWNIPGHPHQWTNAKVVLDVHTDLIGGDRISARRRSVDINMDAVWAASVSSPVADVPIKKLAWEDEVLTCGVHAIKHSCDRILWFVDMALMIRDRKPEEWNRLIERAQQFKLEKPTYYAFIYLQNTIGSAIPGHVLKTLCPSHTGWLERRCMERVMAGKQTGRFGELFTLFMMERIIDKWSFIKETCFPQRDVLAQSYGPAKIDGLFTRFRRIWHVADMAYDVVKQGMQRKRN